MMKKPTWLNSRILSGFIRLPSAGKFFLLYEKLVLIIDRYSKDLFLKLICNDPIERYTCEHAFNHPWITRRFQDDIPLTSPEKMRAFSQSQTLSRVMRFFG